MSFGTGLNVDGPGVHNTALWGGPAIKTDGKMNGWLFFDTDMRKKISYNVNLHKGQNKMGTHWNGIRTGVNWRPGQNVNLSISANYNYQHDTWANWSGYTPTLNLVTSTEDYLLANFEQNTFSSTFRLDWTLTPNLSLQYYGSPFVTAGRYDRFIKVINPKGDDYDSRFYSFTEDEISYNETTGYWEIDEGATGTIDYVIPNLDFNYKSFNSNLVLRWEFLPGSTLYAVWSQGKIDYIDRGLFDLGEDMNTLFTETDPENILLLKVNYLINL